MSYNVLLAEKLEADQYLAQILDKSISEVKKQSLEQSELIYKGIERVSWYASCFLDNYQDVCASQKIEDIRFGEGLVQIVKRKDVIYDMIYIYIKNMTISLSDERVRNISNILNRFGAIYASNSFTNKYFAFVMTGIVCNGFGMRSLIASKFNKRATLAAAMLSIYGHVQTASEAARNLKNRNSIYYNELYREKLEMLYFIIEPLIDSTQPYNVGSPSDEDIAYQLSRLLGL